MERKKVAKLAGFTGALCATAALAGITVSSTGAYFTDSKDGSINTSTGSVKVNTTSTELNYDNLLPGQYKTQKIGYQAAGTGAQDIWLVLPANSSLTGENGDTALGRFGHLRITAPAGGFVSNNLRTYDDGHVDCNRNANGHGGSEQEATRYDEPPIPECGAAHAILLSSNLQPGEYKEASIEFGFTKILKDQSHAGVKTVLTNFKIFATQPGITPGDVNNP